MTDFPSLPSPAARAFVVSDSARPRRAGRRTEDARRTEGDARDACGRERESERERWREARSGMDGSVRVGDGDGDGVRAGEGDGGGATDRGRRAMVGRRDATRRARRRDKTNHRASENNPLGYRRRDDGERARTGSAAEDPRAKADAFPVLTTTGARRVAKADIVWWRVDVDACVEVTSISGVSGHVSSAVFRINKVRSFDSD